MAQNGLFLQIDLTYMTGILPLMSAMSKTKYLKTWRSFVVQSDLVAGMVPTELMVRLYIDTRREVDGLCANTLWCEYSHINKIMKLKYQMTLQVKYCCIFSSFLKYIKICLQC
jgi:hypothetical protein